MLAVLLENKKHRGKDRILIRFKYNYTLKEVLKRNLSALWSKSLNCWYIDNTSSNLETLTSSLKNNYKVTNRVQKSDISYNFNQQQRDFLNGFFKYLRGKRYSKSTIETYTFFIADLVRHFKDIDLETLTNRHIELFIESVFIQRNYSISTQRQFISAVKQLVLYYPHTNIDDLQLVRPKKSRKLPLVLSKEEVIDILKNTRNLKHRAVLALLYSAGLRISELINLKLHDINVDRRQLHIKDAKGRKDRYVILAESFIPLLINYFSSYKPKIFFVEGTNYEKYSASSIRKFLKRSCSQANINKVVTPHTLRHSFATHLLEDGISLRHIQELLGHSKPETTMIYTKVSKKDLLEIKSPLDTILMKLKKQTNLEQKFLLSGNYNG